MVKFKIIIKEIIKLFKNIIYYLILLPIFGLIRVLGLFILLLLALLAVINVTQLRMKYKSIEWLITEEYKLKSVEQIRKINR